MAQDAKAEEQGYRQASGEIKQDTYRRLAEPNRPLTIPQLSTSTKVWFCEDFSANVRAVDISLIGFLTALIIFAYVFHRTFIQWRPFGAPRLTLRTFGYFAASWTTLVLAIFYVPHVREYVGITCYNLFYGSLSLFKTEIAMTRDGFTAGMVQDHITTGLFVFTGLSLFTFATIFVWVYAMSRTQTPVPPPPQQPDPLGIRGKRHDT